MAARPACMFRGREPWKGTNPVNKKLVSALSGGAVLLMSLSGCSDDDSDNKVNDWAKQVCDQVQPQRKKIEAADASIQQATSGNIKPADVQKTDSAAFGAKAEAFKAQAAALQKAGPPPGGDDQKKTQQAAIAELNATSGAYTALQKQVDALDTKDQAKFADGLKDVGEQLQKVSQGSDQALRKLQSGDVGKAMAKQPSCQLEPSAQASPSPSA